MSPTSRLVSALGLAQIVSWGTLFYAIGVLGKPMRAELGTSDVFLFGAFTAGLAVSGVLAPWAGHRIDRDGGRGILSAGSVAGAASMALLACAQGPWTMVAGWLLAGAAMAGTLYDPAFAALSYHTGEQYRRAVTVLTLFGGFASTVFWPLSLLLLEAFGWRTTFAIYAATHLVVCLPIHLAIPPVLDRAVPAAAQATPPGAAHATSILRWLAVCFAIGTFVFGIVAVHMINLLVSSGLTKAQAVTISMLVGPLQVAGRVVEMMVARHVKAVTIGYVALVLMVAALVCLYAVNGMGAMAIAFVVAYGCGNGLLTLVKGTAPAELLGRDNLGARLGYLARAGSYAKALAPAAWSAMLTVGLTQGSALWVLVGLAILAVWTFAIATARRKPTAAAPVRP